MKKWGDIIKNMTLLSQFSLSFITPLLLCLLICWWMSTSLGIGEWIFIPGFFFGLGGSFTVAYKLYLSVTGHQKKEKEKKKNKVSFNRHHQSVFEESFLQSVTYILQKTFFEHALRSAPKNRKLLFLRYYTIKIINNPMKNTIKYNIIQ